MEVKTGGGVSYIHIYMEEEESKFQSLDEALHRIALEKLSVSALWCLLAFGQGTAKSKGFDAVLLSAYPSYFPKQYLTKELMGATTDPPGTQTINLLDSSFYSFNSGMKGV